MSNHQVLGIDLGATNVRGGVVDNTSISDLASTRINSQGSEEQVMQDVFGLIDQILTKETEAIGIGVPSVVDTEKGIVYDVQYIPSWKEVHLKERLEERYKIPVLVNNDANCFALGEYYFGKGKGNDSMIGLTIGTGLGAGVIISKHLYSGPNCGAGEFGMVDYLDHCFEYYCSGQYFQNRYQSDGEVVFQNARSGDAEALRWYGEMGGHLGNAIKMILYAYDIPLIIFGGSVRFAYPYFQQKMWERIQTFAFHKSLERFKIELSALENSGILGAAALCYDAGILINNNRKQ